jgi:hypothetical protein
MNAGAEGAAVETQIMSDKTLPPSHHKQVVLELSWHSVGKFYKVTKITNSSYYVPGEQIPPERIALLNSETYPNWTVSAVDYDYFAAIAALVGGAVSMAANKAML